MFLPLASGYWLVMTTHVTIFFQTRPPASDQKRCNYRKFQTRKCVVVASFYSHLTMILTHNHHLYLYPALERWQLGPADLHEHNPSLIFTRVSGYGQSGPWAPRPGYASVCEAESGFRYINGFPDAQSGGLSGPPVRPNISLGDSIAGLHAAFGTVSELFLRSHLSIIIHAKKL